jgi:antitoxin HicB
MPDDVTVTPANNLAYYSNLPYRVDLVFDPRDSVWIARFPELPGVKAHGSTREQAIEAAEQLKELWLETAIEKKIRIPEPEPEPVYSGKLNLRLPRTLHERVATAARNEAVSLNTYIVEAVAERLERRQFERLFMGFADAVQNLPDAGALAWRRTPRASASGATHGQTETILPSAKAIPAPEQE